MGPKKSDKTDVKIKVNKSVINLRNDSKVKPKVIQSSDRVCNRCKGHQIYAAIKGHNPCPFKDCKCDNCNKYFAKNFAKNESNRRLLLERNKKKTIKTKTKNDNKSIINSLKANAKKILNKSDKKSNNGNTSSVGKTSNKKKSRNSENSGQKTVENPKPIGRPKKRSKRTTPPKLIPEQPIDLNLPEMMAQNEDLGPEIIIDSNDLAPNDSQPNPEESSPLLCAQYLNATKQLSQKLNTFNLQDFELNGALKYFVVRNCLGDVEKAAQSVLISAHEVRRGALFEIEYSKNDPQISGSVQTNAQPLTNNRSANPMLCSTFNRNGRPNGGPNYTPNFTPIHRN